jgi:hypothetical protein
MALPGYNALTDTDPDHFSVYIGDNDPNDYMLLKEMFRRDMTIGVNNGSPPEIIRHGLGYVPFHLVYVLDPSTSRWKLVPHFQAPSTVPDFSALCDTENLYISNYTSSTKFKIFIYYDNVVGDSYIQIDESDGVIKIARQGENAFESRDPNDYIFHSDLNAQKIIKEGNATVTSSGTGSYSFPHASPAGKATNYMVYCTFPDGTTAFIPSGGIISKNVATQFVNDLEMTDTHFIFELGSVGDYNFKYFVFESPFEGEYTWRESRPKNVVAVAKEGYDVLRETNPDKLKYASYFNSLKYFISGSKTVSISGNNENKVVEELVPNTWGSGRRAFITYVNDIFTGGSNTQFGIVPHTSDTASTIHEASSYMSNSFLYLKLRVSETGAFSYTATFHYKIFHNKLNI